MPSWPEATLPAEAYDALEEAAGRHGGVGRGRYDEIWYDEAGHRHRSPCCVWGLVGAMDEPLGSRVTRALADGRVSVARSDAAIEHLTPAPGTPNARVPRVPFRQWAELAVVRRGE